MSSEKILIKYIGMPESLPLQQKKKKKKFYYQDGGGITWNKLFPGITQTGRMQ